MGLQSATSAVGIGGWVPKKEVTEKVGGGDILPPSAWASSVPRVGDGGGLWKARARGPLTHPSSSPQVPLALRRQPGDVMKRTVNKDSKPALPPSSGQNRGAGKQKRLPSFQGPCLSGLWHPMGGPSLHVVSAPRSREGAQSSPRASGSQRARQSSAWGGMGVGGPEFPGRTRRTAQSS